MHGPLAPPSSSSSLTCSHYWPHVPSLYCPPDFHTVIHAVSVAHRGLYLLELEAAAVLTPVGEGTELIQDRARISRQLALSQTVQNIDFEN